MSTSDWHITADELAYYRRNARLEDDVDDEYIKDQLHLLVGHLNEECILQFNPADLPTNAKLFIIGALQFFSSAQYGVTSERMGSVSFSYDFSQLPRSLTDPLLAYGYGRKRNGARFHVF